MTAWVALVTSTLVADTAFIRVTPPVSKKQDAKIFSGAVIWSNSQRSVNMYKYANPLIITLFYSDVFIHIFTDHVENPTIRSCSPYMYVNIFICDYAHITQTSSGFLTLQLCLRNEPLDSVKTIRLACCFQPVSCWDVDERGGLREPSLWGLFAAPRVGQIAWKWWYEYRKKPSASTQDKSLTLSREQMITQSHMTSSWAADGNKSWVLKEKKALRPLTTIVCSFH